MYMFTQYSLHVYYKSYALQDIRYMKKNKLVPKEQVILKLKDKEKSPTCINEEKSR